MKNIDNIDEVIRKYEESEKIRQSIENQHIANWLKELKYCVYRMKKENS